MGWQKIKEAMFYKKLEKKRVQCVLCPRNCKIIPNKKGICGVRQNIKGKLCSLVYGKACSVAVDNIEKKPLFHFAPGTQCLTIATVGCNLICSYCQNWEISRAEKIFGENLPPKEVVRLAKKYKVPGIAYSYTEPTVYYEYALDTMKIAKKEGLYNLWVSNGYTNINPIKKMAKYLDAINIDVKGDIKHYQSLCGIPNETPIKAAIKEYKKQGIHIEITNLLIPTWNDKPNQIKKLVEWVHNLDRNIPLHFSRFHPCYKLTGVSPTPLETLERAHKIAKKTGMNYVYLGNVLDKEKANTYCPKCKEILIIRQGNQLIENRLRKNNCSKCSETIPIIP